MGNTISRIVARRPKSTVAVTLLVAVYFYAKAYRPKYWLLWKFTTLVAQLRRIAPRSFPLDRDLPAPPDYEDKNCWAAYPGKRSLAELVPETETYVPEQARRCDAFFVHPTGYYGKRWNAGAQEGAAASEQTRNWMLSTQASVLNATCRIYAPYYRQANIDSFAVDRKLGTCALDVAYQDILAAFRHFVSSIEPSGPIVLASHSQGGFHLNRLLLEVVEKDHALRQRIVAAYIVGSSLPKSLFLQSYKYFKFSQSPTDLHCIVGWDTISEWYDSKFPPFNHVLEEWPGHHATRREDRFSEILNTNPLTFRPFSSQENCSGSDVDSKWLGLCTAETTLNRSYSLPEVISNRALDFATTRLKRSYPIEPGQFYTRKNSNGNLVVPSLPRKSLGLMKNICVFDWYHPIDFELFYFNIRANIKERVDAYLRNSMPSTIHTDHGDVTDPYIVFMVEKKRRELAKEQCRLEALRNSKEKAETLAR